jgi:hypothetical protein
MSKPLIALILVAATNYSLANIAGSYASDFPTEKASTTVAQQFWTAGSKNVLVEFQVEFLLSPRCPGTVSKEGGLESRDAANNCLWDDSLFGNKTAKPDIYAILVEGNEPFPKRKDCDNTSSAICIFECPKDQLRCKFTLLLNSQQQYSLSLGDKDVLVDDMAGIFDISSSQLTKLSQGPLTLKDRKFRSVVNLSLVNVNQNDLSDCLFAIETLASDNVNNPNGSDIQKLKKAKSFINLIISYLITGKIQIGLPDYRIPQWIAGACKPFTESVKPPQTY